MMKPSIWAALMVAVLPSLAAAMDIGTFTGLLNQARASGGLAALSPNAALNTAAQAHADDMAQHGYFDHRGRNGSTPGRRMRAAGYCWTKSAENIAMGPGTEAGAMQIWMDSQGHRDNILARGVTEFGVAQNGALWVLVFAKPC